jgi:hypothetical protein
MIFLNGLIKYLKILILFYFIGKILFIKYFSLNNELIVKSFIEENKNNFFSNSSVLPIILEKKKLFVFLSKCLGKNITKVKYIFFGPSLRFGNMIKFLEKAIYYCHIIDCKKIFLDKKKIWFIRKNLKIKKYKMSIEIKNEKDIITYDTIIIDKTDNFFNYNKYTKYEYNLDIFKNEIIANLPKLKINKNDLYIYIRSGDIFIKPHRFYSQPPLCFYKKILDNYDFNKIYLITENMNNPVINQILNYFPNIIYNKNKIQMDISLLVHAYNIVGANSSFLSNILRININLLFLWMFQFLIRKNIKKTKFNINKFYSLNKIKIFYMYSSKRYYEEMKIWNNTKSQRDLMLNENCTSDFFIFY